MNAFPPSEIAWEKAHIHQSYTSTIVVTTSVFTGATLASLVARLYARSLASARLGLDDYLAICSMVCLVGLTISACLSAHWGLGQHLIVAAQKPENLIKLGKASQLAFSVFVDLSLTLSKLSVLALLTRIFTLHNRAFKIILLFWVTWVILYFIAGILIIFLECRPLSTNWGVPRKCQPHPTLSVTFAVFNSISDVGILALPQPLIWRLQLKTGRKVALSMIFLIGAFGTAVGIARIPILAGMGQHQIDVTYSQSLGVLFTALEPAAALLCACLPMTNSLFRHLPKLRTYRPLLRSLSSLRNKLTSRADEKPPLEGAVWSPLDDEARRAHGIQNASVDNRGCHRRGGSDATELRGSSSSTTLNRGGVSSETGLVSVDDRDLEKTGQM